MVAAAGVALGLLWSRWRIVRRAARSRRVGRRAERRARRVLRAAGYRVVATQPTATVTVVVDGCPLSFTVRGDLLVRRRRKLFLAEIKGGAGGSSVSNRATRRQLLEYACAFSVDGVLLVDMHERAVRRVAFPGL